MRWLLITIAVFLSLSVLGQENERDTTYYKKYPKKLSAGSFIAIRNYALLIAPEYNNMGVDSLRSNYQPNASRIVGISLNLDRIGANLSVSIPDDFKSQELYGTSRRIEANLGFYQKKGIVGGQFIATQGFADKNSTNYLDNVLDEDQYYVREDLRVWNVMTSYLYYWNWKKFSARSAISFSERQLKSAGTLVTSLQVRHFRVAGDSSIIPYPTRPFYQDLQNLQEIRFNELSTGIGYTYTFVPAEYWFIHGAVKVEATFQFQRYRETSMNFDDRFVVNPALDYRISAGYSHDYFWLAVLFAGYADLYNLPDVVMAWSYFNVSFHFGIRIPTPQTINKVYRSAIPEQ